MNFNRVKVAIFGQTYTIDGDAPKEHILKLAEYLNDKMEEVRQNSSINNPVQIAILAALNVTDEYFQLKKLKAGTDSEVEKRALALISMLDQGLIGDEFSKSAPPTMKN
jgi:cell division protein ZapA